MLENLDHFAIGALLGLVLYAAFKYVGVLVLLAIANRRKTPSPLGAAYGMRPRDGDYPTHVWFGTTLITSRSWLTVPRFTRKRPATWTGWTLTLPGVAVSTMHSRRDHSAAEKYAEHIPSWLLAVPVFLALATIYAFTGATWRGVTATLLVAYLCVLVTALYAGLAEYAYDAETPDETLEWEAYEVGRRAATRYADDLARFNTGQRHAPPVYPVNPYLNRRAAAASRPTEVNLVVHHHADGGSDSFAKRINDVISRSAAHTASRRVA